MAKKNKFSILNVLSSGHVLLYIICLSSTFFVLRVRANDEETKSNNEEGYRLEDITVYAEKTESKLQKTPLALTTFTADEIINAGISRIPDLALRTPGLAIGNNSNTSTPEMFIRGVGTNSFSIGSDLSIGIYVDDVYISRPSAMFTKLSDIESIEILRGPQGTLYGRNTIGGAINVRTKKPQETLEIVQQLTLGNFDLVDLNVAVSIPIIQEYLLGRFSFHYEDREGYSKNIFDNSHIADADNFGGRGSLWFLPSESIDLLLNFDYHQDRATGISYKPVITGAPILGMTGLPTVTDLGHVEPSDPFRVNHDGESKEERDTYGISGKLTVEFPDFSLVSISAYRGLDFDLIDDVDATSLQLFDFFQDTEQEQFSQELRLISDNDNRLHWLMGLYFFTENSNNTPSTVLQDLSLILGPGDYSATNRSEVTAQNFAVYSQVDFALTERFKIILGLRATYEEKEIEIERVSNNLLILGAGFPKTRDNDRWQALTPKIGLQFQQNEELMFFGAISRGFKSGGFDAFQTEIEEPFDPEFLTAYEVGVKSSWFDRRLRLNATAFYYDYKDLQVDTLVGTTIITTNAAESTIMGIEFEAASRPVTGLDIGGSIAVLDTQYDKFINDSGSDVSDNSLKRAPEFSTAFMIHYSMELSDRALLGFRVEHQYQSRIFFTETNENILSQGGFHNINARVTYEMISGRFAIALFGKNLTDEESIDVAADLRGLFGTVTTSYRAPRTYGIEITCRF